MDNIKTVTAIEYDGLDVRTITIVLRVLSSDPHFDLKQAIRDACTQYVLTDEGRAVWEYNCSCFNWADFAGSVPNEICRQHGFEKVDCGLVSEDNPDWDECLVDEDALPDEEDEADGC